MRILMVAHRIPYPPHTGDKSRAFHVARHLGRHHRLTLAFIVDDPEDMPGLDTLRAEVTPDLEYARVWKRWATVRGGLALARGGTLTLGYFGSRALRARIAERLARERYDLIYVSSSAMAQYVPAGLDIPTVMDFVDVDSDKWLQYGRHARPPLGWVYGAEGWRLRAYEASVARWARLCLVTTAAEEALLGSFAPWATTAVIPNGIDLAQYQPVERPSEEPVVMFTGAMDYLPNVDAVRYFHDEILPRVRARVPETRLSIVGLNPSPAVRKLAETPGVIVTGAVPDVRPYYAQAAVCIAPLRIARGVQNKVIQAMAMGLPVVASGRACQGLTAEAGAHLHVADDAAAFAERVVSLLQDPDERRRLGRRGRAFVEANHAWETSLARLDSRLARFAPAPPRSAAPAPAGRASERPAPRPRVSAP